MDYTVEKEVTINLELTIQDLADLILACRVATGTLPVDSQSHRLTDKMALLENIMHEARR